MIYLQLCLLFFFIANFPLISAREKKKTDQILLITIPKCGTSLTIKCLYSLMNSKRNIEELKEAGIMWKDYLFPGIQLVKNLANKKSFYCYTHMIYDQKKMDLLKSSTLFFIFRDPRDQIISLYFYMKKLANENNYFFWDWVNSFTIEEFIYYMIKEGSFLEDCPEFPPGICTFYQAYEPYLTQPNICKIRFEDLVGPMGGGSQVKQLLAVQSIAKCLRIDLKEKTLHAICCSLFGLKETIKGDRPHSNFREGKIGSWKNYFTEDHKKVFKETAGDLLIRWGYEKDLNW